MPQKALTTLLCDITKAQYQNIIDIKLQGNPNYVKISNIKKPLILSTN